MNVFTKLNTLLRAGARESAERITEANAIRIYRQEVVDAENLLEKRRLHLAGLVATRKDLERELERASARIASRERQIARLSDDERSDEVLMLAATDIASYEAHKNQLRQRYTDIIRRIDTQELTLRKLVNEIREHRREIRILSCELDRGGLRSADQYRSTVASHLATLRETRASITGAVRDSDTAESSMEEALERVDGDPVDRELASQGKDDVTVHINQVLLRLRGIGHAPA
tara:strand:- start:434791 stop:435489 length:699 start_codon:yes stop_codon:yes gene_type:complete